MLCHALRAPSLADRSKCGVIASSIALQILLQCTKDGLTTAEFEKRLAEYGPNKLPEGTRNPFLVYLSYMWNPLSWAMEVRMHTQKMFWTKPPAADATAASLRAAGALSCARRMQRTSFVG